MRRLRIVERSWWPIAAIGLVEVWALVFWWFFLVQFAYRYLHIGLGLGGALYPGFFTLPILVGVAIYQVIVRKVTDGLSTKGVIVWTVVGPSIIVTVLLVLACPTDSQLGFPAELWRAIGEASLPCGLFSSRTTGEPPHVDEAGVARAEDGYLVLRTGCV